MRIVRITVGTAMVLCLTLAPIEGASKGKGPAPIKVSSSKAPTKATPSPKTTKTTAKVTKAPKVTTTAKASSTPKTKTPKATTASQNKLAKAETKSAKKSSITTTTTPTTTTPTTTATIDFTKGKVGEKLTKNSKLAEKLGTKLTALGYTGDVFEAGYGFKNFGQFNAAVNNAENHGLSFEQLKTLMTGVSVDAAGVVLYANRNPDGTVTMVPLEALTNPAPTSSLGQAKKIIATSVVAPDPTAPTTVTN